MNLDKISKKKKSKIPVDVKPMLATLVDKPFDEEGWMYEMKWDGFRALGYINKGKVELRSRNNKDFNAKFYPVYNALKEWGADAVVDGEIVVINENGLPDFSALQTWRSEADGMLIYYLFDLLWLNGFDLMEVPLKERRKLLEQIVPKNGLLKHSESFPDNSASELFKLTDELGLEGIIAKKESSIYKPDARTKDWLKIKAQKHQEVVIAGYTKNENTSRPFSSLITGIYDNGTLIPIAPVGTGFSIKLQNEILQKLKPLVTSKCPFPFVPDYNKASRFRPNPPRAEVVWVKPKLVAEISYRTVSSDGSFRHPSFKGLREDKSVNEVKREHAKPVEEIIKPKPTKPSKLHTSTGKKERKTLVNPSEKSQVRKVNGVDLKLTNLQKLFWVKKNITKGDMVNYYYQIAPFILPYIKNRPETLNRFPNGFDQKSFYQKDVKGKVPEWVKTFDYYSFADKRNKEFFVVNDEASLLYMINLGCIEVNPWSSTTERPDNPDWCIIDLDPDKNSFEEVIKAAQVTKAVLDQIKVPSFCKTSGSTGLHIYIPLDKNWTYEDSKEFGRAIVTAVHKEIASFTSIERLTRNRKGKLYLDFLQNRPQATVAAPYSLRPKPDATVSMPLHWEEVKKGLKMKDFTLFNAVERVRSEGDLFKGVLNKGINLGKAMKKVKTLL